MRNMVMMVTMMVTMMMMMMIIIMLVTMMMMMMMKVIQYLSVDKSSRHVQRGTAGGRTDHRWTVHTVHCSYPSRDV